MALESLTVEASDEALAVVHFSGTCLPDVGDRIVLAASDRQRWFANDGNVQVEAFDSDVKRGCFSHTRVYAVPADLHTFYAVAGNYVEKDGSGEAWVYGNLSVKLVRTGGPDLLVSALTVDSYSATDLTFSYTIENVGSTPVPLDGLAIQAMVSADTVLDISGDVAAGGKVYEALASGGARPRRILQ